MPTEASPATAMPGTPGAGVQPAGRAASLTFRSRQPSVPGQPAAGARASMPGGATGSSTSNIQG